MGPLVYKPEKKNTPVIGAGSAANRRAPVRLPQEPDMETNNDALAGIDTTGTGIRDDVFLQIFSNYTSPKKHTILTIIARIYQVVAATPPKTTAAALQLKQSFDDALLMLKAVPGLGPGEADQMDDFLYTLTFNTPERLESYLEYDLLLEEKK